MKIMLNTDEVMSRAKSLGIDRLSTLCQAAGANYSTIRNNISIRAGISIENAYLLSDYLGCTINDIIIAEW